LICTLKEFYRCLFNRSYSNYFMSATGHRVGTCVAVFMGINWDKDSSLHLSLFLSKKETATFLLQTLVILVCFRLSETKLRYSYTPWAGKLIGILEISIWILLHRILKQLNYCCDTHYLPIVFHCHSSQNRIIQTYDATTFCHS